jgi:NADPH:quinone reductase-like Zn-dependent oxidoreductase
MNQEDEMKAMVADGSGSVRLAEVDEPRAAPDEAIVEVEAYSVNRGETFLLEHPRDGWRPGKDVAGRVIVAAADGSGPAVGTRVVGHPEAEGWAERVAVPTAALAEVSASVPAEIAAPLPLAGLTAVRLLRRAGSLLGQRLLITGASGGVGHYVTELAIAAGAEVTAVSADAERGAVLRAFGADVVSEVPEASGWFDIVLESVAGAPFTAARRKAKPNGLIIWFGQAGREPITVDFFDWVDHTVGAPIVQFNYMRSDRSVAEDLATLVRLVGQDRLHPEIGTLLTWDHTAQVVEDLRARRVRGNAVLTLA